MTRCECPERSTGAAPEYLYRPEELNGRIHEPGQCRGDFELKQYLRDGVGLITLCSCCCFETDVEVDA